MKRYALPLLLIVVGVWMQTGCFKVPVFEHTEYAGQRDFRELIGDDKSKRPIRTGAITREQIIALLGQPQLVSRDGAAIGYIYETIRSVWAYPLCFSTRNADHRGYFVRMDFDANNVLSNWRMTHVDGVHSSFMYSDWRYSSAPEGPMDLINPRNPPDGRRPFSVTRPTTFPAK